MRLLHRYRQNLFTPIKYGLLYNWYAATSQQTVEYGYLYNWYVGNDPRNVTSSDDWVVPTLAQETTMRTYLGGASVAGGKLKETGIVYWDSPNTGATNETGFNARGSGIRGFSNLKQTFWAWCKDQDNATSGYGYSIENNSASLTNRSSLKTQGQCIRLLYVGVGSPTTYLGNDGVTYPVVQIGSQYWTAENLMETKYRNGDAIPEVTDNTAWAALTTGARCAYNNTITNVGVGSRITSSDDWVVPTTTQRNTLTTYLGGNSAAGGKLKEIGYTYWDNPNTGATNEVGFNGRGSGYRAGSFSNLNLGGYFLCSNENSATELSGWSIGNTVTSLTNRSAPKYEGWSIRLIYVGSGTPTSYTGNDGKVYRVVTIGTQTWLADNLAETKYRDGSYISGYDGGVYTPIANGTWAALTTGALCAYNNDTNNI